MSAQVTESEAAHRNWEAPPVSYPARDKAALLALILVPALLVALVVAVLTGWWWLGGVLLLLWAGKTVAEARLRDTVMLRRLQAVRSGADEFPRLRNLVSGLAHDLAVPPPQLYVMPEGGANALVRAGGSGGLIVLSRSLVETFTRTELEAVVAHCLTRIHADDFVYSNLAARWSDLGAGLAPRVGTSHDIRAVAVTRYPPALASALARCDDRIVRYAPLWFAADAPSHEPTAARIAALSDL